MGNFYLDIETTGLEPDKHKIITIQYQELERNSGRPTGELIILKEWESSEMDIIKQFLDESGIVSGYDFGFIPVGYNLNFEHNFFKEKTKKYGFPQLDILDKPFIDLSAVGILINKGEFKNSGLDKITGKPTDGHLIPIWYENKEYEKITDYVQTEAKEFIKFNEILYGELPLLREKIKKSHF